MYRLAMPTEAIYVQIYFIQSSKSQIVNLLLHEAMK